MTVYRDPRTKGDWFWGSLYLILCGLLLGPFFWIESTILSILYLPLWVAGVYILGKGLEVVRKEFED